MKRYLIDRMGAVFRFHIVNDMEIPVHMAFVADKEEQHADVDVFLLKDTAGLVSKIAGGAASHLVRTGFDGYSYVETYNKDARRYFCFFEPKLNEEYVFNRVLVSSFAVFQDVLESIFLHCAAVSVGDDALLFVAPSGGGKTTISNIAEEKGFEVIDDETCLIKKHGNAYYVDRFPFHDREREPKGRRVKGVYFLEKAEKDSLGELSEIGALKRFIPEASCLYRNMVPDGEIAQKSRHVFDFVGEMLKEIDHGLLEFTKTGEALNCLV